MSCRVASDTRLVSDDPVDRTSEGEGDVTACAVCGRDLWWCGLPPALDGDVWICGECDAARNFDSLEDL